MSVRPSVRQEHLGENVILSDAIWVKVVILFGEYFSYLISCYLRYAADFFGEIPHTNLHLVYNSQGPLIRLQITCIYIYKKKI